MVLVLCRDLQHLNYGIFTLFCFGFVKGCCQRVRILESRSWELDFKFDGFPWAKETVSDDLSWSWGNWPSDFFIFVCVFCSNNVLIDILEDFIEAEFTESLKGVSEEGGWPSESAPSVGSDFGDAVDHAFAEVGVDLFFALHDVEGDDGGVCESASEYTSDHAFKVIAGIVNVTHNLLINN